MTTHKPSERNPLPAGPQPARPVNSSLVPMLEARSVALVGASPRPGTFGQRMIEEVVKSPSRPDIYLVNPRYRDIGGRRCYPSLADLPRPVDLVLLAVPDAALEQQLTLAAGRGDHSAVIFGNAHSSETSQPDPGAAPAHPRPPQQPLPPVDRPSPPPHQAPPPHQPHPSPQRLPPPPDRDPWMYRQAHQDEPIGTSMSEAPPGAHPDRPPGEPTLRERLAAIATSAGMQLCGAGCMGFVNVARGLRAIGYTEPDPLPAGPVALVTHSGSVFSTMLRARRGIGFSIAVSSGQELVTAAPSYLDYALGLPETRVLALVLEAIREPDRLREVLARAAGRDVPVVLLAAGRSASGRMMVAAHSGALAAGDGGWEALARAYGIHRVSDLAELADSVELFAIGRRARRGRPGGIATVHDSGLERAHVADLAEEIGVPFAPIAETTRARLAEILDPGLIPANPLDVWGTGANTHALFASSLIALAEDPAVAAVALAVDLVRELDGDLAYPQAVLDAAARTTKPLAVLANLAGAVDPDFAAQLRQHGIPVLEGLRPGLTALRHLLAHANRPPATAPPSPDELASSTVPSTAAAPADSANSPAAPAIAAPYVPAGPAGPAGADGSRSRRDRGAALLAAGITGGPPLLELLGEYGIATAAARQAGDEQSALAAARSIGYPVVLKTAAPAITHKSDARGVLLDIRGPAELAAAYADLSARLGPEVLVCESVPPGTELALGIARDPDLGPLIVVGAGGVLVETLADRGLALPPVHEETARQMITELRIARLLAGVRGAPPADLAAVVRAITGLSELAIDLGGDLEALDVNPLICGPSGATAVDVLAVPRAAPPILADS